MTRIKLTGGSYESQSVNADCQITRNWYPEKIESGDGNTDVALYPSPGTKLFVDLTPAPPPPPVVTFGGYFADTNNNVVRRVLAGNISTVAGNGTGGFSGDGGPATAAELNTPEGVAVDSAGNFYIADFSNQRIRKVTVSTGVISTVVGTGVAGFSGDGGLATLAQLNNPVAVVFDSTGNMYICCSSNNVIRKVDVVTGFISTILGEPGTAGYFGDTRTAVLQLTSVDITDGINTVYHGTIPGGAGNAYVTGTSNFVTVVGFTNSVNNGPFWCTASTNTTITLANVFGAAETHAATAYTAEFSLVFSIAVANGNVYVADFPNAVIRKLTSSGIVTTIAGTGTSGFTGDGGLATAAQISDPNGIAIDTLGNVFIADSSNFRIRRIDATTGFISTIAGTGTTGFSGDGGPATAAQVGTLWGLAFDSSGNLYLADLGNERIRKIDTLGIITTFAGNGSTGYTGDGGPGTSAELSNPTGLA